MVPGAIGASLGLSEQLFVIDFRGPAILDDNVAIDDYRLDIGAAAVFYQRIDGIAHRPIPGRAQIDDDQISLATRGKATQIRAPQCVRARDRRGVEDLGRSRARSVAIDQP